MKKTITHKFLLATIAFGSLLSSCTKDFTETNTDPNNAPTALPQQLLAPALVNTLTYNMLRNRNFNNELMQVTVTQNDGDGQVFRYDYRNSLSDYLYNGWYDQLTNFKDIDTIARTQLNFNASYQGISLICQSWIYSLLTDTYGDVPYFQSNKAKKEDGGITEPVFDKQKDIYLDIFQKLEKANELLKAGTAIVNSSDPVYNGSVSRWRKFGNSLYLRLLLRLSGKAEVATTVQSKIRSMVGVDSLSYPIMTSNAESAVLRWTGLPPYTSPYLAVREQDWRQPAIASFFIDNLVNWDDPRISLSSTYATGSPTLINRWAIAPYLGSFSGVPSGYSPGTGVAQKSYFYSTTANTNTGPTLMTEPLGGMIMNYAEVKFILAEAALKGWIPGSAETYYNDGVLNSIRLWLPNWNVPVINYLQNPLGRDMRLSAASTFDDKMEYIHLQKYYALFLNDMQQWFEHRRTGRPTIPKGPGLRNNGVMPARMTYPVYVQSTNPTNYQLAVAAQGPDVISTNVWWQKP